MPNKIKKEKETILKPNKEKLINVDNIHYFFIALIVLVLCICLGVGIYVYKEDKYHSHKDNALVVFTYTEALDEGYNVFTLSETDKKRIFTEYNTLEVQEVDEISRGKYLDFNEEIYNSGILEYMEDKERIVTNNDWSLYIKFVDGTRKYLYSDVLNEKDIDMSSVIETIEKYFKRSTLYK